MIRSFANFTEWTAGNLFGDNTHPVEYDGGLGIAVCVRRDTGETVRFLVNPQTSAATVAQQAASQLQVPLPVVATSPPRGGLVLAGVPVWFWVTGTAPITTTATVPGLSATLTARPDHTEVGIDGGPTLTCDGAGLPYDPGHPDADSPCSHTFQEAGTAAVSITVTWSLTWTATNGQSGTLPDVSRTTALTVPVEQAQAVTD